MNLQENWLPILIIALVIIGFIGYIIYLILNKGIKNVALEAILKAEEFYNSTTGKERLEIAVNYVYELLPASIRTILPKEFLKNYIEKIIQKTFDKVKDLLDYHLAELKQAQLEIIKLKGELKNEE